MTAEALRQSLDDAPLSGVQVRALAVVVLLSALDGYDVLSMTFAAPAIFHAWGIGATALGAILSAGLAGMALGSFLLAPLADFVGRRAMVLVSLALMGLSSLLCATAVAVAPLLLFRVITGLGVGCCVPIINALAGELANRRRRPLAVALMAIGYPAGGLSGGLLAGALLRAGAWPGIFLAGVAIAAALIPAVLWGLPEAPSFLIGGGRPNDLRRLNEFLSATGRAPIAVLPKPEVQRRRGVAPSLYPLMLMIGAVSGFFLFASVAGLYGLVALAFSDESRAAGAGFVIGVGRVSSAIAPLLTGWLLSCGSGRAGVSTLFGVGALVAAVILATRPIVSN